MGRNSENYFGSVCCWTRSSPKNQLTDMYLKVSKTDIDEMRIEKIQARITIQRMEIVNEKLTRTLFELQAKLAEKENQISRLNAKFNCDGIDSEGSSVTIQVNSTTSIDTRPGLTNKKTPGIDFENYLIKDGQGTPSGFCYPSIDVKNETKTECRLKEDAEKEKFVDISNNAEKNLVKYDELGLEVKSIPTLKLSYFANEVLEDDEECNFWFYK